MSPTLKSLAFALLAACSLPAAANLTYSTGQDQDNNGIDDYFKVDGAAAYLVTQTANGWPTLPNGAITSGRYISFAADQSNATQGGRPVTYSHYTFSFNWSGASQTAFDFRWLSDDYLSDVVLNGTSLGVNNLGASQPWTISNSVNGVTGNLSNGLNTIDFVVWNSGGGPTGLAADFTVHGNASLNVPEPSSLALAGLGVFLAVGARRSLKAREG